MMWILAYSFFLAGIVVHWLWTEFKPAIKQWRVNRRKFTCDACKTTKRAKDGFSPLALDLEYGDGLVPLNLRLCRSCAPDA